MIEERASGSWSNPATGSSGSRYRIHITGAGWALYEREWARYRELYPDVEAPDPARGWCKTSTADNCEPVRDDAVPAAFNHLR